MKSLRGRLLLGLLALVAITSVFASLITYRRVLAETSDLFDYELRQMALSLRDQASAGAGAPAAQPGDADYFIEIWDLFGNEVYVSRPNLFISNAVLGYTDITMAGERWRVYSLWTTNAVIQVAQPWGVREARARAAAVRVLAGLLLLLLLMAAALIAIVSRGLAPLRRAASEVQRRDVHSLAPISAPELPSEAAPLIEELNRLLARLAAAFDKQRAFVADAAHELRSPLTAVSLQLQLLERGRDERARAAARAKLGAAVERATHLVAQLLTLARSEPEGALIELAPVSLEACVREAVTDVHALAHARQIELELEAATDVRVRGNAEQLRVLARNLIDNAVRYTPPAGTVRVRVGSEQGPEGARAVLAVEDSGPGIPAAERERAFDRFYRRPGATEGGSGLGLAIVKAIADRHGARICLGESDAHGLKATVMLPALASGP